MITSDVRAALLEEYLELKERVSPLEKRLSLVRDQLRDIVTEEGHFVDELRGVGVQLEACVAAGMVTERELEREGVLFRTLHSRALVVKKIPRSHVAGSTLCE